MKEVLDAIAQANYDELQEILDMATKRYGEVCPNWELSTMVIEKTRDKNEQLDRMIRFLERLKQHN